MAEDLIRITQGCRSYDANIYKRDGWYVGREMPESLEYHKESGFVYTVTDLSAMDMAGIHKFCFIGGHEDLLGLERELLERYPDQASVVFSREDCLEVMAANVNKGNSAQKALATFGLDIDDAIAFGDGMNDFEMLSMAAKGFVMSNATERLRNALPDHPVTGHCDDDGVARQLIDIFGIRK